MLAGDRARALFGVDHVNVQPYWGSPANLAVHLALARPGDTVMGMALPMGGPSTHGWPVSATGEWCSSVQYSVRRDTGRVDLGRGPRSGDPRAAQTDLLRRHGDPAGGRMDR
jgi:glycine hydroxymethyltransferase